MSGVGVDIDQRPRGAGEALRGRLLVAALCALLLRGLGSTLFDAGFLAGEGAEIIELGAAHTAELVYGDGVDEGRLEGEDTLNADIIRHFTYSETFFCAFAVDADYNAAVLLDTLLVTLFDTICHSHCVAGAE